jgi:uncharacterized protein (TIGR03435 family)
LFFCLSFRSAAEESAFCRVPHLRDSFIVAKVGLRVCPNRLLQPTNNTVILSGEIRALCESRSRRTCGCLFHPVIPTEAAHSFTVSGAARDPAFRSRHPACTILPEEKYMIRRIITAALLTCATALAQAPTPTKPLAFEVVSIRPDKSGSMGMSWSTTPDGYRVNGQSIWQTILIAYFPQGDSYWSTAGRITGMRTWPAWLSQPYSINAKVSGADLAEWQKQGAALDKKPILREMLQTMLADRCHLVAHRVPGPPVNGFSLEVSKRGPRLAASKPNEVYPQGAKLASGGVMVPPHIGDKWLLRFYGTTMADFADYLSKNSIGHPVQDHTGLTGRYNFVVSWVDDPDSKRPEGVISMDDPDVLSHYDIEGLGLRLAPIKLPAETLVIDHIEKPSDN